MNDVRPKPTMMVTVKTSLVTSINCLDFLRTIKNGMNNENNVRSHNLQEQNFEKNKLDWIQSDEFMLKIKMKPFNDIDTFI